jgi:ArsR family transcriptional regulator
MGKAPAILRWMSSLSDPTRVRALRLLERHELSVAELCDVLQLPQSTVSRHLKVLSDDAWVGSRREGTSHLYALSERLGAPAKRLWALLRDELGENGSSRSDDQRLERVLAFRQTRSQAFFAKSAAYWDKLREEMFGARLEVPILAGLLDEGATVGDLGCGTGWLLPALSPFVARVVGVDASAQMLQMARHRVGRLANVELRRGRVEHLPLADGSLDAALLVLVLPHVAEPQRAVAELGRVLRPGGRALLLDLQTHERAEYHQQMGHVWLGFSPGAVEGWLGAAGLASVRVRALAPQSSAKGPPLFIATARKPARRSARRSPASPVRTSSPPE